MEKRLMRYLQALDNARQHTAKQIATLEKDERQDEADLEKVRQNVYGIFEALAKADANEARKTDDAAAVFAKLHTQRFETFPEPWRKRLETAVAHGDIITQTIEKTKLDTVREIWQLFEKTEEAT